MCSLIFTLETVKNVALFCCVRKNWYVCTKDYNMDLTHNKIAYVNCCVGAFADRFKLTTAQAYAYLRRFKGIDFLIDCYAAEHTLSIDDAVEDLSQICKKHGGRITC